MYIPHFTTKHGPNSIYVGLCNYILFLTATASDHTLSHACSKISLLQPKPHQLRCHSLQVIQNPALHHSLRNIKSRLLPTRLPLPSHILEEIKELGRRISNNINIAPDAHALPQQNTTSSIPRPSFKAGSKLSHVVIRGFTPWYTGTSPAPSLSPSNPAALVLLLLFPNNSTTTAASLSTGIQSTQLNGPSSSGSFPTCLDDATMLGSHFPASAIPHLLC